MTGASGFIGSRVAAVARERGIEVRALARREWLGPPVVPVNQHVLGRLPRFVPAAALDGCDAIVHCAVSTDSDIGVARSVNVIGTLELARVARDAGARAFIFLSSQSARADTSSAYGRTKYEAEALLLRDPSLNAIVIRPGLVCGRGGLFWRLVQTVRRGPLAPILAGDAPVQPIFVDDLVTAIVRCVEDPSRYANRAFAIGMVTPVTLRAFLREVANEVGGRHAIVSVPVRPIETTLRWTERMGLRLPVTSENVVGAREARAMETAADMAELGVPERSLRDVLQRAMAAPLETAPSADDVPTRALLIGAGRIGIVHAVTLSRLPGVVLTGLLDRRPQALSLLQSVGVRTAGFTSELAARRGRTYDATVIATPPFTHLGLARSALAHGERVLIEKPAARAPEDFPELDALAERAGERALVGYLMPQMLQLRPWLARLRSGELGRTRSFVGVTLVSLIDAHSGPRWETTKSASGGGVLINSATHVLSLIHEAFGEPKATRTQISSRYSREVEDCAVVEFDYGGFSGTHYVSWCIAGFPRQENRLIVETDRGVLTLCATAATFAAHGKSLAIDHQLDHDVGFNLAPDYAGGGISAELRELSGHRFGDPLDRPMTLKKALAIERVLFALTESASRVTEFTSTNRRSTPASVPPPVSAMANLCFDVRHAGTDVLRVVREAKASKIMLRTAQLASVSALDSYLFVTMPDFLDYTRLITDGQRVELMRRLGPGGLAAATLRGTMSVLKARSVGFWSVAEALLAAELTKVPNDFSGTLLLHPYLADLAIALDRIDVLQNLLDRMRVKRRARVGFHSNLAGEAANAVLLLRRLPDVIVVLASPNGSAIETIRHWFDVDDRASRIELIAEVGPAPLELHEFALAHPERWTAQGPLVVNGLTLASDDPQVRSRWEQEWSSVFPGVEAPQIGLVQ